MNKSRQLPPHPGVSRRAFVRAAGSVAFAAAAPHVVRAQTPDTLVVNTQGGEYQEIVETTVIKPFEQRFGVRVVHDPTGTASQDYARIRAARGAPGFDVAGLLTPPEMILGARENLLERISEREVPNLRHAWPVASRVIPAVGVAHTLQYAAMIYNKEKIERPRSWADYWEPARRYGERIRGHVVNYNPVNLLSIYALIHAAQLGGGGVDNMEPAWERLRAQKPYVGAVITGSSEAVPYFENGEVWISPYWSARSGYYMARGAPLDMLVPEEGVIGLFDCAAVPVGAKNKRLAYEFLNFRLEPEVQRAFSLAYFSSPGRGDIADWPPEFARTQILTAEQIAKVQFPDSELIGQHRRDWTLRWQEVMG
jgi:putative spermidine/putrescine transport system substrate-binding protein